MTQTSDPRETEAQTKGIPAGAINREPRGRGRRLRGAVAFRLGIAIVSGEHQPGDILPSEAEASAALNVSRTAYRDAIRTLTAKGMVQSRPRIGTQVQPRHQWNLLDPEVLTWTFSGAPDQGVVRSLFELRSLIEPNAAAIAATRRTRADIKAMKDALAAMARHGLDNAAGQAADRDFHHAILKATDNEYLAFLTTSIGTAVTLTTAFKQRWKELPRDPIPDHRRVLDAIAAGDPDAARTAMGRLVEQALEDTRLAME